MKKILFIFICVAFSSVISSQEHKYNIGLRGGETSGIVLRNYFNENSAVEGMIKFYQEGFKFTLLKEVFSKSSLSSTNNFYLVKGAGFHAGVINTDNYKFFSKRYYLSEETVNPLFGLDGLIGMEYRIKSFPLVIGLDWKPYFEFSRIQYFRLEPWDVGFSIRYAFN